MCGFAWDTNSWSPCPKPWVLSKYIFSAQTEPQKMQTPALLRGERRGMKSGQSDRGGTQAYNLRDEGWVRLQTELGIPWGKTLHAWCTESPINKEEPGALNSVNNTVREFLCIQWLGEALYSVSVPSLVHCSLSWVVPQCTIEASVVITFLAMKVPIATPSVRKPGLIYWRSASKQPVETLTGRWPSAWGSRPRQATQCWMLLLCRCPSGVAITEATGPHSLCLRVTMLLLCLRVENIQSEPYEKNALSRHNHALFYIYIKTQIHPDFLLSLSYLVQSYLFSQACQVFFPTCKSLYSSNSKIPWLIPDFCLLLQQAAYHPEVSKEVQMRALRYGNECATGYLGLLEHVLVVRHHYPHTECTLTHTVTVCTVTVYTAQCYPSVPTVPKTFHQLETSIRSRPAGILQPCLTAAL